MVHAGEYSEHLPHTAGCNGSRAAGERASRIISRSRDYHYSKVDIARTTVFEVAVPPGGALLFLTQSFQWIDHARSARRHIRSKQCHGGGKRREAG